LCSRELGLFDGLEDPLVQWSATLVAAVTLNCFIWLLVAVAVLSTKEQRKGAWLLAAVVIILVIIADRKHWIAVPY